MQVLSAVKEWWGRVTCSHYRAECLGSFLKGIRPHFYYHCPDCHKYFAKPWN